MIHPDYGAKHPQTKQCLQHLKTKCEFTLAMLQDDAILDGESSTKSSLPINSSFLRENQLATDLSNRECKEDGFGEASGALSYRPKFSRSNFFWHNPLNQIEDESPITFTLCSRPSEPKLLTESGEKI